MTSPQPVTPADVLRATADAFERGLIEWGRDNFIGRTLDFEVCRCTLGGISYVVDPADTDGNPFWVREEVRDLAAAAAVLLAMYLADVESHPRYQADDGDDIVEIVGGWNDEDGRELEQVVSALRAAADWADARQAVSA